MEPMNEKAQVRAEASQPPSPHASRQRGRELVAAWSRHRRGSGIVFLVVLALTAVVAIVRPPVYEAEASILVKYGREYVYRPEVGEQRAVIAMTPEEILNSEEQIIVSDELIRGVVKAVGPTRLYPAVFGAAPSLDAAVRAFRKSLTAEAVPRSSVLRVTFRNRDPAVAADALHVLVDAYKQRHLEVFSDATLEFVEKQLRVYDERLRASEGALETFRQKQGVFNYQEQMALLLRQRGDLETASRQADVELAELQRRGEALNAALERPRPVMRKPVPTASEAIEIDLMRLEGEAESRKSRIAGLATQRAAVERQIRTLDRAQRELAALGRETAERERIYDAQRVKFEEMRATYEMAEQKLSNLAIIDRGARPSVPATSRAFRLLVGFLLALATALLYPFVAEYLSQAMSTPEALERGLHVPVLATVKEGGASASPPPPSRT
ncbi:MAG TPA: hypothetical protein VF841_07895 [Anaeromyxobacter sp.]